MRAPTPAGIAAATSRQKCSKRDEQTGHAQQRDVRRLHPVRVVGGAYLEYDETRLIERDHLARPGGRFGEDRNEKGWQT